ncbi:hypothetical protein CTAYLR_004569 [Chrysophaeum taylorii]|uniref:Uncharacterized protein n=1 Tax=Chrysophaeum taylorii TaxID=2483200 RepID=A0AAD7UDE8_9STRA|nr:hypothetical protein CTAYLR_004569 [Chrysophaeum taylorii]
MLEEEGVLGLAEAFEAIQPWAYKADLWRYAQLWACGGIYLDAKLALAQDLVKFLNLAGFHHAALRETKVPLLLTCHDERASESIREPTLRRIKCVYQAFMVAEPRHPALLKTIRHVVANVRDRWYPPASLSKYGNLFITGPCAMGLATQIDDPRWEDSIKLTTRLGYNQLGRRPWQAIRYIVGNWIPRGRDADDEMSLAAFVANERVHSTERTNYYVGMFARHEVYVDDHQKKTDASSIRLSYKSPSPE